MGCPALAQGCPEGSSPQQPREPLSRQGTWRWLSSALLPVLVAVTIPSPSLLSSGSILRAPGRSRSPPCIQRCTTAGAGHRQGSFQESPLALQQSLSCSQGTSPFDETITKPALRLPTGSRKVLFVTGCWKGHGVLLPLLFLACALSPSEQGSAPMPWTPDTPSWCGCIPDALAPEARGRAAGRMLSGCPHTAHAGWALYRPEKLLWGDESCVRTRHRQLQPWHREIMGILGCRQRTGFCWSLLAAKPTGEGSGPGCHGHRSASEGVDRISPCCARHGATGVQWEAGVWRDPRKRRALSQRMHTHPGRQTGSCQGLSASLPRPGWHQ